MHLMQCHRLNPIVRKLGIHLRRGRNSIYLDGRYTKERIYRCKKPGLRLGILPKLQIQILKFAKKS